MARYLQNKSVDTTVYNTFYTTNVSIVKEFTTQLNICIQAYNTFTYLEYLDNSKIVWKNPNEIQLQFNENIKKVRSLYEKMKHILPKPNNGITNKIKQINEIYTYIIGDLIIFNLYNNERATTLIQLDKRNYRNKILEHVNICRKYYDTLRESVNSDKIYLDELNKINETNKKHILSMGCLIPKSMGKSPINVLSIDEICTIFSKIKYDSLYLNPDINHTNDNVETAICNRVGKCMTNIYETYEKQMFHIYIKQHYQLEAKRKQSKTILKLAFVSWKKNIQVYYDLSSMTHFIQNKYIKCIKCDKSTMISIHYKGKTPKCNLCKAAQ